MGAAGLGYVILEADGSKVAGKGPIAKFIQQAALDVLLERTGAKAGDAVFFSADAKADRAAYLAGHARTRLGRERGRWGQRLHPDRISRSRNDMGAPC